MAISAFIPTIWSASVLRAFEKRSVFGSLLSRVYEGDAKFGNVVKVPKVGAVEVRPYVLKTPITYDDVDGSTIPITIDQQSYWALKTEDVERTQSSPDFLGAATKNAGVALKDTIDVYVAGILAAGAEILTNLGTVLAPLSIKADDVYGLFALIGQNLTEANAPTGGRWVVIPPWLHKKLVLAKIASEGNNSAIISDGYVGKFLGFETFVSNNVPVTDSKYSVMAGVADCGTLITQINETETLRDANQFGDLVRGLAVYTSKVLDGSVLAKAILTEAAEA